MRWLTPRRTESHRQKRFVDLLSALQGLGLVVGLVDRKEYRGNRASASVVAYGADELGRRGLGPRVDARRHARRRGETDVGVETTVEVVLLGFGLPEAHREGRSSLDPRPFARQRRDRLGSGAASWDDVLPGPARQAEALMSSLPHRDGAVWG